MRCPVYDTKLHVMMRFRFWRGIPRDVMANVLYCDIVENKFELQSGSEVLFRTNTIGKGMNSLTLLAMS